MLASLRLTPTPAQQKAAGRQQRQGGGLGDSAGPGHVRDVRPQGLAPFARWLRSPAVTTSGEQVEPVVWDSGCLEEVCGACTMVVDGQVRQSCSCLANEQLAKTGKNHIELTPMTKFPVVRDLFVDRQRMFDNLKKIKGWVPIDGTHDLGPGPTRNPRAARRALRLLALHDLRLLSGGLPAVHQRQHLHRRPGHRPDAVLQPARNRQEAQI